MIKSETSECGIFVIAFATALAYGENPTQYLFDWSEMRSHLTMCLEWGQMTVFPFKKLCKVKKAVKTMEKVCIYCSCRMHELPNTKWIECTKCKEWYILLLLPPPLILLLSTSSSSSPLLIFLLLLLCSSSSSTPPPPLLLLTKDSI